MRIGRLPIVAVTALALLAGFSQAALGHPATRGLRVKSGLYGSGDVYLEVDTKTRIVAFHFKLYCVDPYAGQSVTSGPTPVAGKMKGNRRGATVFLSGEYSGPAESSPGTQYAVWSLNGKFTSPTHFKGRVEYEALTSPEPRADRPQCVDAKLIHLVLQPPSD